MQLIHRSSLHLYQVKLVILCYLFSLQQLDELLSSLLPSSFDYFYHILTCDAFFDIFDMIFCFCILMLNVLQPRIQHLKEVSQTDEIVVFPFISNSDMFYLSQVSSSKIRGQDPRYATVFLLLIDQCKYTGWVLK